MNDPRITAYALNELQGSEREKFESDLAANPHLQRDLLSACELTDALGEVTREPEERLEPQERERLLREIVSNQEALRERRKIIRFAVPASLAAAASIAVLLLVSGGTTTHKPAVAAARGPEMPGDTGFPGGSAAEIASNGAAFTFKGTGKLSSSDRSVAFTPVERDEQSNSSVHGIRTVHLSESGKAAQGGLPGNHHLQVRQRPLISSEDIALWGIAPAAPAGIAP